MLAWPNRIVLIVSRNYHDVAAENNDASISDIKWYRQFCPGYKQAIGPSKSPLFQGLRGQDRPCLSNVNHRFSFNYSIKMWMESHGKPNFFGRIPFFVSS